MKRRLRRARRRPGTSYQIAYTRMMGPKLINEAKVNAAWNGQRIPPVGDTWKRSTHGFTFPTINSTGGEYKDGIPDVSPSGFANFRGPSFAKRKRGHSEFPAFLR